MLVVKVELWPFGAAGRAREISRLYIANDGTGTVGLGNYIGALVTLGPGEVAEIPAPVRPNGKPAERHGAVSRHVRDEGVWPLIERMLNDIHRRLG